MADPEGNKGESRGPRGKLSFRCWDDRASHDLPVIPEDVLKQETEKAAVHAIGWTIAIIGVLLAIILPIVIGIIVSAKKAETTAPGTVVASPHR